MAAPAPKEGAAAPLMDTLCQVDIVGPFIVDGAELNPGDILSEVQPPYLAPWLHTRARAIATQVEARSTSSIQDGVVTRSFNPYLNCRDLAVASTVSRACHTAAAHMGSLSSCRGCQRLQVLPNRQAGSQAGSAAAHQSMGTAAAPRALAASGQAEEIQEEEEEDEEDDEEDYEDEEEEIDEEEEEEEDEELEEEEEEEEEEEDEVLELKDDDKDKLPQKPSRALPVDGVVEAASSQEAAAADEKNVRFRAAAEAQLKAEAKALKAWKAAKGTDDLSLKAAHEAAQAIAEAEEPKLERKEAPGLEQVCQEVKEKVEAASQDMLKAFAEKMLQSLMNQKVPTEELKAAVAQFKVSPDTFLMSDANVKAKVSIETSSAGSSDSRSAKTETEASKLAASACNPGVLVQEMMKLLQSKVQAGKVKSSSGDVEAEIKGLWKVPLTSEVMVQLKGEKEKDGQHAKAVLRGVQEIRHTASSQDAPKDTSAAKVAAAASTASSDTAAAPDGVKDVDEMVVINMLNLNQSASSNKGPAISLKRSFKKKMSGADAASDMEVPNADAMTEFQQALSAAASAAGSAQTGATTSVKGSIQDIETLEKVSAKLADQVAELALKAPIEIGWTAKKDEESAAAPKEVEVPVPSVAARSAKSRACASSEDKAAPPDQEVQSAAAQNSRPSAIPFQKASEKKAASQEETTQPSSASRPSVGPSASPASPAASAVPSSAPSAGSNGTASGGAPAAAAASDASPSTATTVPRRHARLSGMKGFQCNGLYVEDRPDTFVQKAAEVEDPEVSYFLKLYDSWHGNSCADVFQVQAGNNMRTITLAGFEIDGVNVQYRERREPKLMVDQNETYWTANQDFFLFWCGKHSRWRVGRATDWARIQSGDPLSVAEGPQNCVDLRAPSKGWHEWKAPKWVYRKHAGITSVSSSGPRGERVIASCAPDGWRIAAQRQTKQRGGSTQWRPAQSVKLEIQAAGSTAWSLYPQNCRYEDEAAAADRCMEELLRAEGTATSASNRSPKASRHKQKLETPTDTPTAKSSASKAPTQQRTPEEGAEERLLRLQLQAEEELLREEEEEDKRRQEEANKRKEAKRRREQEESRRKEAAEGARSREEKARKAREEEARKAREEEAKKAREEHAARRAAEEEARRQEERRKKEEEKQRLEIEKARKAAEKKQKAEERRRQEAEAKRKLEEERAEEARRQAEIKQKELEQAQRAEEERHRRELEQLQREEEAKRRREIEQQQREREEEAKRRAEEARKQAEAKKKWLDQARSREEERRRLEAEQRRSEEEARRKNEENRKRAEQEVIRRLQASRAEAEMRKRREEQRPANEAAARAAAYPVEAEMEKQRQFANNASHSQLNMAPAPSTLSVAEADRGAGQSRTGNDYSDQPMVRPRDEGIVEPTLCQVTLQYNATNVGYLTAYPAEWIVVQCFEGGDEWEPGGWGYGYVRGDEKRCGWLPQRVLNLRG